MFPRRIAFLLALVLCLAVPFPAGADFQPPHRERILFRLLWGPLPVGFAELTAEPVFVQGRLDRWEHRLHARSNSFVDLFVKVRDTITGVAGPARNRSLSYGKDILEGDIDRSFRTLFHWDRNEAEFLPDNGRRRRMPLSGDILDPLSVFHHFRDKGLGVGRVHEARVTDGKRLSTATIRIPARERIKTPDGEVDAYRVEVAMPGIDGIFRMGEEGTFLVWVTADFDKMPVRIESDVIIGGHTGHFTGVLVESERIPVLPSQNSERDR